MGEDVLITPVLDKDGNAIGVKKYQLRGHQVAFCKDQLREVEDGVALCDKTRDYCTTATVIAVGPDVSAPEKDKTKREMHGWPKCSDLPLKKGMRVLLPDGCDTIKHPFDVDYEGLIHANDIIAIVEGLDEDEC